MAQIKVLSQHLVNKIAAGEVIERPASVVKELIENALDSGAGRIGVAVEKGGKQSVVVTDDGSGMDEADLAKAFLPHATSKLSDDDDLMHIATMGFRGEALASIAAISHAQLRTRRADNDSGYEISAGGGELFPVKPCAAAPGTTATVRDLFFNTPARRKFLRADATEFAHISEAVTRTALAHKEVAFTLAHNGRVSLDLPATETLEQRAADLFGHELVDDLLSIRPQNDPVGVSGLIGPPAAARATAKWQYFFLNRRFIRDRLLGNALKEAFRGLIDPHHQPVAILFVEVESEAVDVNVHPSKIEVRFRDGQSVRSHVLAALRTTLQDAELRPTARLGEGESVGDGQMPDDRRSQSLRDALAEFFKSQPSPRQGHLQFSAPHNRLEQRPSVSPTIGPWGPAQRPERPMPFPPPGAVASESHRRGPAVPVARTGEQGHATPPAMQVHDAYIVVSDGDGIVIVDQHALHERILYNQLVGRIASGTLESQRLLLPASVPVTASQRAMLHEQEQLLGRVGIEVSDFGPGTVAVQRFPSFLENLDPAAFLAEALDALGEDDPAVDSERLLQKLLQIMACKAAVKAGDPLSAEEISALLARREGLENATSCPHGRPTQIRLTLKDLDKQFKRT
ncbi:MAG: DNA mismatch repair endonuclease MutL [Planctomycetes bacterium]|nr:DNA mismatch repair endonuclease MutL [Planctomycetota bacterium]